MAARPLKRRVVFYGWEDESARVAPFDRVAAARDVNALPDTDWAFEDWDGFTTAVLVDQIGDKQTPTFLRCFRLRHGDELPHVISARHASPLQLQQDESVGDWTHVVIWPDGYAAHDSRRDAPALTRLASYFKNQVQQRVRFYPLYDRALVDQLDALDELKSVDVQLDLSKAEQQENAARAGLFGGLLQVGESAGAVKIKTRVSVGQKRNYFLNRAVKDEIGVLSDHATEGLLDNLVVTGLANNEIVTIDFLRRRLDDDVSVPRSRELGNAPDPRTMFAAIERSRASLEDAPRRLQRAVRVR